MLIKNDSFAGVKKIILIAIINDVPETRKNIRDLLNLVELHDPTVYGCSAWFVGDLKIKNNAAGIQEHGCTCPCPYCTWRRNDDDPKIMVRTFGSIRNDHKKWLTAGAKKLDLKKFNNCVDLPVFKDVEDLARIIEFLPPSELHLLIGIVSHFHEILVKVDEDAVKKWLNAAHVTIDGNVSGFKGNSSRKLLTHLDVLREALIGDAHYYVDVLGAFNNVVESSFGVERKHDYSETIQHFKYLLNLHNISKTPKIHEVVEHVQEFLEENDYGLGYYSEQAFESIHTVWQTFFANYCSNPGNSNYLSALHRAVINFNAENI